MCGDFGHGGWNTFRMSVENITLTYRRVIWIALGATHTRTQVTHTHIHTLTCKLCPLSPDTNNTSASCWGQRCNSFSIKTDVTWGFTIQWQWMMLKCSKNCQLIDRSIEQRCWQVADVVKQCQREVSESQLSNLIKNDNLYWRVKFSFWQAWSISGDSPAHRHAAIGVKSPYA